MTKNFLRHEPQTIWSRLCLEFASHIWRKQQEILGSDAFTTPEKSPEQVSAYAGGTLLQRSRFYLHSINTSVLYQQKLSNLFSSQVGIFICVLFVSDCSFPSWDICILLFCTLLEKSLTSSSTLEDLQMCSHMGSFRDYPDFILRGLQEKLRMTSAATGLDICVLTFSH